MSEPNATPAGRMMPAADSYRKHDGARGDGRGRPLGEVRDGPALFGRDLFGDAVVRPQAPLAARFVVPPFSVLDARQGEWQERKAGWISVGIKSEIGRGMVRPHGKDTRPAEYGSGDKYTGGDCWRSGAARLNENTVSSRNAMALVGGYEGSSAGTSGTSIFDPVLCELAYRWFSPLGGLVLDPFAGGSVRGVVASMLGRRYLGIDLRPEQIEANEAQAAELCGDPMPRWITGDSRDIARLGQPADFVFSCPPYADLEVYSDDPRDLSTLAYPAFRKAYAEIIAASVWLLRRDAFACFVVGDARGKDGLYYGLPWHTIQAFEAAGCRLYNEAVLVTSVGSLPVRVGKQFDAGRKLGKTHQNVLIFVKGDPERASQAIERAA